MNGKNNIRMRQAQFDTPFQITQRPQNYILESLFIIVFVCRLVDMHEICKDTKELTVVYYLFLQQYI